MMAEVMELYPLAPAPTNITPEALFNNRRTLDGQELRVNAPRLARRERSRSDAERRAAMRAKLVGLSKRGSRLGKYLSN